MPLLCHKKPAKCLYFTTFTIFVPFQLFSVTVFCMFSMLRQNYGKKGVELPQKCIAYLWRDRFRLDFFLIIRTKEYFVHVSEFFDSKQILDRFFVYIHGGLSKMYKITAKKIHNMLMISSEGVLMETVMFAIMYRFIFTYKYLIIMFRLKN